jgi:hypothetical protein
MHAFVGVGAGGAVSECQFKAIGLPVLVEEAIVNRTWTRIGDYEQSRWTSQGMPLLYDSGDCKSDAGCRGCCEPKAVNAPFKIKLLCALTNLP